MMLGGRGLNGPVETAEVFRALGTVFSAVAYLSIIGGTGHIWSAR
jgi:hypothetical protein